MPCQSFRTYSCLKPSTFLKDAYYNISTSGCVYVDTNGDVSSILNVSGYADCIKISTPFLHIVGLRFQFFDGIGLPFLKQGQTSLLRVVTNSLPFCGVGVTSLPIVGMEIQANGHVRHDMTFCLYLHSNNGQGSHPHQLDGNHHFVGFQHISTTLGRKGLLLYLAILGPTGFFQKCFVETMYPCNNL